MRWTHLPPVLYLVFALYVWINFGNTAQDGFANLGLLLATFPVAVLGVALTLALGQSGFVLIPSGMGYYAAHAIYFGPAVLLTSVLVYGSCQAVDWLWSGLGRLLASIRK